MHIPRSLFTALWMLQAYAETTDEFNHHPAPVEGFVCEHPQYKIRKVSSSPQIIYIENFITVQEREHLKNVTQSTFRHSALAGDSGASRGSSRTSQSSYVARDAVVHCIEERAVTFQGFDIPRGYLEPLQLVKYGIGEQYHFHTDWFTDPRYAFAVNGGNRLSSFFVYVSVSEDVTGGGTNFPLVDAPRDERWCETGIVDCDEQYEKGVTFRPLEGNAIFWENLTPEGAGDMRTLHAGLPVTTGEKIGMNIWTRQSPLSEEARGPDEYPEL